MKKNTSACQAVPAVALHAQTVNQLLPWVATLGQIRSAFSHAGFKLPGMGVQLLESQRERDHHLEQVQIRKACEVEKMAERIRAYSPANPALTPANILKLIAAIAEDLKLERCRPAPGSAAKALLRADMGNGVAMYLEWRDPMLLRKWGSLEMSFMLKEFDAASPTPDEHANWPWLAELNNIVGPNFYWWKNTDWNRVALGILAHAELRKLCTSVRTGVVA